MLVLLSWPLTLFSKDRLHATVCSLVVQIWSLRIHIYFSLTICLLWSWFFQFLQKSSQYLECYLYSFKYK